MDQTRAREFGDERADEDAFYFVDSRLEYPHVTLGYVGDIGRVLQPGGWAGFQISNDPAVEAGMDVELAFGEGTQLCLIRTRKRAV